ncbi:MAG: LamG-like jellyroll fold domain-containing protein, partial [Gammaproteobacteria bacterium]
FELSAGDAPPNRGDITLTTGASAYPLSQASGVIIANPNVLRLGAPSSHNIVEVPGELTHSVPGGFPDGMWLSTTHVAGAGGGEVNFNVTLAHFPFANGWIAGHVDNDGTLLASNGDVTVTTTAKVGWYTLTIPGVNAASDGMLFTVGGSNENSGNTVVTTPFPDETGWEVTVMDQQQDFPAGVDQEWSFVYIPYSSINLIGGRVDDDGSLLNSVGSFTVNNTGTGMYEIAVPGKTDADGILLLTISKYATKSGVWGPDDNLLAYMYDPSANSGNGAFVIESVDLAGATPQNTEFVFAFIEYANPIFSGTASNPDPMNRAIHVDPTVVLSWDAPSDVGSPTYNVYIVENDPNFESAFPVAIDLAVTSYDPPGDLELNTTYYWRVELYDPGEDGTFVGDIWAFAIGGMATDPYPADGAPGVRLNTELGWTGDENIATSYDVYLSTDPNVPTPSSFLGNVTETTYVDPPTGDELTTYYWRVDERDDQGVIAPGEIWSFTTGGLLAHWAFDDGSGYLAADSSGNGFNGDISGAAWTDGVLGGALALDGIDDYVDFGALSEFEIANGTITGWFYVNSWPVRGGIISKDGSGYLDDFELMRDRAGSNKLHFEMHPIAAPALTSVKSDDDIALASWTHFAISWGSEGMNMWVDGVQQADTNPWTDGIVSSGFPLVIGTGQYGSFEGLVDEFRLFSGILNDSEIQAIFADS